MIKLLVVEDDKVLSNNIKEILAAIGEITQVYDGSEGLFELESGVYDLAILDLMMPEMNGYEVLAKIRKEKIQTPVLILTAKDSLEDKIEGFDSDTTITVIEVYMSNLRKHLRSTGLDKEIKTLRNVGYILQRV
ncbi:response regulator [Enterococcus faecium]|nr:response regulator [Enterococcus faecium]